jgi:thiamine pyrophosphate-dependent acetolactate synthase large subunit-like protein
VTKSRTEAARNQAATISRLRSSQLRLEILIARAFDGYGEKVEEPGKVRAALQRGLKAVASGQAALIDIRLAKAAESNERPDRAN